MDASNPAPEHLSTPGNQALDENPGALPGGWVAYLLRCSDGTFYAGCSNNVAKRLRVHGAGQVKYTRGRLPVELVFVTPEPSRGAALSTEAAIKRLPRALKMALGEQKGCAKVRRT